MVGALVGAGATHRMAQGGGVQAFAGAGLGWVEGEGASGRRAGESQRWYCRTDLGEEMVADEVGEWDWGDGGGVSAPQQGQHDRPQHLPGATGPPRPPPVGRARRTGGAAVQIGQVLLDELRGDGERPEALGVPLVEGAGQEPAYPRRSGGRRAVRRRGADGRPPHRARMVGWPA